MTSKLVDWANSWFLYQGEAQYPAKDRLWVYVALVDLIACGTSSKSDLQTVHRYFTYLLRGWNPVTAWVKRSAYEKPKEVEGLFTNDYVEVVKSLLNFEKKPTNSEVYRLLGIYSRTARYLGGKKYTDYEEEQCTLMRLSIWLLSRKMRPTIPQDPQSVRECIWLSQKSRSAGEGYSLDVEYTDNQSVFSTSWLDRHVERMMMTDFPMTTIVETISYMAWFEAVVRASRMSSCKIDLPSDTVKEISDIVEKQVSEMYSFLDSRPMTSEDPLAPKGRILDVFGIHPRKTNSVN